MSMLVGSVCSIKARLHKAAGDAEETQKLSLALKSCLSTPEGLRILHSQGMVCYFK